MITLNLLDLSLYTCEFQREEPALLNLSMYVVTDLLWTIIRGRQPVSLFQQVYQVVDDHLALLFISHLVHKHLEQRKIVSIKRFCRQHCRQVTK